jgi:hypothetical protein
MFKPWQSVMIGRSTTLSDLDINLKQKGSFSKHVSGFITEGRGFTLIGHETMISLVTVLVSDLGFEHNTYIEKVHAKGIAQGFELCPHEAAIELHIQHMNIVDPGNRYIFMMREVHCRDSKYWGRYTLALGTKHGKQFLTRASGMPTEVLRKGDQIVFKIPDSHQSPQ